MANGNGASLQSKPPEKNGKGDEKVTKTPPGPLSSPPPSMIKERKGELEKHMMEPERASVPEEKREMVCRELDYMLSTLDMDEAKNVDRRVAIRSRFAAMSEDERQLYIQEIYNRFSENYDDYMEETGHYGAIRRLLTKEASVHTFQFPVLDISAGTAVPLAHFLEQINRKHMNIREAIPLVRSNYTGPVVYVNDLADKMIGIAEARMEALKHRISSEAEKLGLPAPPILSNNLSNGDDIAYKNYSFRRLHSSLKKKFGTILVSQTFHVITYKDKELLAKAINWALAPGGRVVLLEEFDWKTSPHLTKETPPSVIKVVGAIASPLKTKKELIMLFRDSEGVPYDMVSRSIERIDREDPGHEMTITVLQKPDPANKTLHIFF